MYPEPLPTQFWGPEQLSPEAFRELAARIDMRAEVEAILRALGGMQTVVDVGGGTDFLTEIAHRARVIVEDRAESLSLGEGSVDAAIATRVLQCCDDPLRAIDELARVAKRRVVIVQAAPGNDLVEIYNREAAIAGLPPANHGYLMSHASTRLEEADFNVAMYRVPSPVRTTDAHALAEVLSRLHFAGHPKRAEMIAAIEPYIRHRGTKLADDGALLVATASSASVASRR